MFSEWLRREEWQRGKMFKGSEVCKVFECSETFFALQMSLVRRIEEMKSKWQNGHKSQSSLNILRSLLYLSDVGNC